MMQVLEGDISFSSSAPSFTIRPAASLAAGWRARVRRGGIVHASCPCAPPFGVRFGAMFAWSASPVVDPVMSLLNEDGESIADDVVNWHGGKPGSYYGTELDLQLEWTYKEHFIWTLEGALLLPGDALQDESGAAVTSFLFENRFTFVF